MLVNATSEFKTHQYYQLTDCRCAGWTETAPHIYKPALTE